MSKDVHMIQNIFFNHTQHLVYFLPGQYHIARG